MANVTPASMLAEQHRKNHQIIISGKDRTPITPGGDDRLQHGLDGLRVAGRDWSALPGAEGNRELFFHLVRA